MTCSLIRKTMLFFITIHSLQALSTDSKNAFDILQQAKDSFEALKNKKASTASPEISESTEPTDSPDSATPTDPDTKDSKAPKANFAIKEKFPFVTPDLFQLFQLPEESKNIESLRTTFTLPGSNKDGNTAKKNKAPSKDEGLRDEDRDKKTGMIATKEALPMRQLESAELTRGDMQKAIRVHFVDRDLNLKTPNTEERRAIKEDSTGDSPVDSTVDSRDELSPDLKTFTAPYNPKQGEELLGTDTIPKNAEEEMSSLKKPFSKPEDNPKSYLEVFKVPTEEK